MLALLWVIAAVSGCWHLVETVRARRAGRPTLLAALAALALATACLALALPKVWPLFVLGFPSTASVIVDGLPSAWRCPRALSSRVHRRSTIIPEPHA